MCCAQLQTNYYLAAQITELREGVHGRQHDWQTNEQRSNQYTFLSSSDCGLTKTMTLITHPCRCYNDWVISQCTITTINGLHKTEHIVVTQWITVYLYKTGQVYISTNDYMFITDFYYCCFQMAEWPEKKILITLY